MLAYSLNTEHLERLKSNSAEIFRSTFAHICGFVYIYTMLFVFIGFVILRALAFSMPTVKDRQNSQQAGSEDILDI